MNLLKLLALGVTASLFAAFLKQNNNAGAASAAAVFCIITLRFSVRAAEKVFSFADEMIAGCGLDKQFFIPVVKAVIIGVSVRICGDICRDCGQTGIASSLETAGTIAGIICILPLLDVVFETLKGV